MKTKHILGLAVGIIALGFTSNLRAEDAAKPPADLKAKVEELRGLPPEERRVKQRELMQSLTPEQRKELRASIQKHQHGAVHPDANGKKRSELTSEQAEARKKKAAERLTVLEKKKADGTITEQESKQLERMKTAQERVKAGKKKAARATEKTPAKEEPKP
jgi:hypothetical protein